MSNIIKMNKNNKLSFSSLQKCLLCQEQFERNLNKLPRVMLCGHQLCSDCIKREVITNKYLTCPQCDQTFPKHICSQFQANFFYLDLVDHLQSNYGHALSVLTDENRNCQNIPLNNPQTSRVASHQANPYHQYPPHANNNFTFNHHHQNMHNPSSQTIQLKKCKNPTCPNQTELLFCSQECQFHFDQKSTNKEHPQNTYSNGSDYFNEI